MSALAGSGLEGLLKTVSTGVSGRRRRADLTLGFSEGRKRAWLFRQGVIEAEEQVRDGYRLRVLWSDRQARAYRGL